MPFKKISIILGAVLITVASCLPAFAAPKFFVDGVKQPVGKLTPFMERGVLYVPAKYAAQGMHAQIKWQSKLQTAIIINETKNKTLIVTVGKKFAIANNSFIEMPAAPKIVRGTIFIPLRPMASAFGMQIAWNAKQEIASLSTPEVLQTAPVQIPAVVEKPVVTIPAVVESQKPVPSAVPASATQTAIIATSPAITLTQSAVQTPTAAAIEVAQKAEQKDLSGLWADNGKNTAYLYQSGAYASGQYTINGKTGVLKGEVSPDGIKGIYWQGGKENKFELLVEPVTGHLRGSFDGKDIALSQGQKGYLIDSDKITNFNGKWMDIWGNVITIVQPDAKDATRVVNGTYVDATGKDMGSFKGTFKSGVYSGEYIQNASKDKGPGVFEFTLNASGMSYNGKYSSPGAKDLNFQWDAIRATN